jgi:hypothetical protein
MNSSRAFLKFMKLVVALNTESSKILVSAAVEGNNSFAAVVDSHRIE